MHLEMNKCIPPVSWDDESLKKYSQGVCINPKAHLQLINLVTAFISNKMSSNIDEKNLFQYSMRKTA
jgi:hypothetical protein